MSRLEPDELTKAFATIARELEAAAGPAQTRELVTHRAVETVPGCVYAGISMINQRGTISTVAATDDVVPHIDAIQYETRQGPALGAIADHVVYTIDDLQQEHRWPRFTARATAETGIASMVSFRLFTSDTDTGALNLYSKQPRAFDASSRGIGTILAAHAAIALAAADDHRATIDLDAALQSNRQIGMAIGIMIARADLTPEQAFDFLVNVSQRLNRKLRDVAAAIIEAKGMPDGLDTHT